jgi:hypothetical protein
MPKSLPAALQGKQLIVMPAARLQLTRCIGLTGQNAILVGLVAPVDAPRRKKPTYALPTVFLAAFRDSTQQTYERKGHPIGSMNDEELERLRKFFVANAEEIERPHSRLLSLLRGLARIRNRHSGSSKKNAAKEAELDQQKKKAA